jgi:hypothetical protein
MQNLKRICIQTKKVCIQKLKKVCIQNLKRYVRQKKCMKNKKNIKRKNANVTFMPPFKILYYRNWVFLKLKDAVKNVPFCQSFT